jgi:uncharacterized protein with PIN domain
LTEKRLLVPPREAENQFEKFFREADIAEAPTDSTIGAAAENFADYLSSGYAIGNGATLLFEGDDFAETDINQ